MARDVRQVLASDHFWSERAADRRNGALTEEDRERREALRDFYAHWPVFSDGDRHRRLRRAAIRLLRDVVTPGLPSSCERLVAHRLNQSRAGTFDGMERVARPLAREAVVALTGRAGADRLIELGGVVMNELATPRIEMARIDAALEVIDALRDWLRTAPAGPPSAFVAGLAELWEDDTLGPDVATALLTQIVTGAYEPTVTALCLVGERVTGGVLAESPRQTVLEEVVRLATPFRFASRYARRPVTVGPHRLDVGDGIVLCLGTANFDPDHYPEPLELRRRGRTPRSFSFGAGEHYCPGAPLAQAITGVLLDSLTRLGVHLSVERVEREPELSMLRYRRLDGRLVHRDVPAPRVPHRDVRPGTAFRCPLTTSLGAAVTVLVIDTDPGLDDAHALAMALTPSPTRPRLPVAAVCTVAGNVDIDTVTANARWLLGAYGGAAAETPVHRGAAGPIAGPTVRAADIHGADGLGDLPRWAVPDVPERAAPAALTLIDAARRHPGGTTVVALGPLTNVALAVRLEPRLPELLDRVVVMGGAIHGRGNLTLNAEFNFGADPAAADLVLASFPRLTLVSWETTLAHCFTPAEFAGFFAGDGRAAGVLRRIVENRFATDPGYAGRPAYLRADPLAMAVALDPGVVTGAEHHRVCVGYGPGGLAHGLTAVDWCDTRTDRPPVEIVLEVDRDRLLELLTIH
ncbi:hypothetical protein AQ490_05805 [Wenjunlia vitaminophila]|uniref:Inosine/uridine-preferring nucleoside hydrolase domain-containing protein n=1 Tax=Wenjunlia vitaminophila TaxID=76728 RepID=A0A0T6LPM7_WENVI|nr:cytochrome P450 [Wenjunlia vitaminophila]KRV47873.1 hypothetical protein AQ490_05805 [Wenjunlia vitaminophila]